VGASGGSVEQDILVARAALAGMQDPKHARHQRLVLAAPGIYQRIGPAVRDPVTSNRTVAEPTPARQCRRATPSVDTSCGRGCCRRTHGRWRAQRSG
jgi:hypothetical protein